MRAVSSTYHDILFEVAKLHPDHNIKLIKFQDFSVCKNKTNQSALELNIVNTDGTVTDISWRTCATGVSKSVKTKMDGAFRSAIQSQIMLFKHESTSTTCELCKQALQGAVHVDHVNQFDGIVSSFLEQSKLPPPSGYCQKTDETNRNQFKECDKEFEAAFQEYHKQHATLRMLCPSCNLHRSR